MVSEFCRAFLGRQVSPELEEVIQTLKKKFGTELGISPVKPGDGIEPTDGIIVEWFGRAPLALFRELQDEQVEIFGPYLWNWQILCQWGPTLERGVQILCLDTPKKRLDYLCGFWYC